MRNPPDRTPTIKGWVLLLTETGGTSEGATFRDFVTAANGQLRANGFSVLSADEWLERFEAQGCLS